MRKFKFAYILQAVLTGVILWQTRAFANGCPFPNFCDDPWNTTCNTDAGCTLGTHISSGEACCTPQTGSCCLYGMNYFRCNPTGCENATYRDKKSGPTSTTCQNQSCV
jgi:hypothetical protein